LPILLLNSDIPAVFRQVILVKYGLFSLSNFRFIAFLPLLRVFFAVPIAFFPLCGYDETTVVVIEERNDL